jgi:hypothetical protein
VIAKDMLRVRRAGYAPPWGWRGSAGAWGAAVPPARRPRAAKLCALRAARAKAAGRHNTAALWLEMAGALW